MAMDRVERAWEAWAALSTKAERAEFLTMMRAAYFQQRKAELRANGHAHDGKVSSLSDLTLTEADFRAH